MTYLMLILLIAAATSREIVSSYESAIFGCTNTAIKITRCHYDAENEEIYRECIYKMGNKIRIDMEFENNTIRTFVYDGENGSYDGNQLTTLSSLEMVLFGCTCGYLGAMERFTRSFYDDSDVIMISGRQGNLLYLDARSQLPMRYELKNAVVEFTEYAHIDGFGQMPFMIAKMSEEEILSMTKITSVSKHVGFPLDFFDTPQSNQQITLD
jgi:hypothetical protein